MKKRLLKLTGTVFSICLATSLYAQTSGTLTFTFTEIAKTPTYNGNSQHVLAVWIQSNTGAFVKTKLRYVGGGTDDHLPTWAANASCTSGIATSTGCNTVDGVTGATRSSWTTYTVSWDGKKGAAATGTLQPDGIYKVSIQSTWDHGTAGTAITSYTFTKGATVDHQTPAANAYFSGIILDWTPSATSTGINENLSKNPEISVYPNPTNGVLNVDFKNASSIKVLNTLGSVIYEAKTDQPTEGTKNIDLSSFSNGIYFINVSNGKESLNYKFILNK